MTFTAWLYKITKDKEGEVRITLIVPKKEAQGIMDLPEETNILVTLVPEAKEEV